MIGWLRKLRIPRPTGQGLRTAALFLGAPIFGGLLAWQLYGLEPERVCSIPSAFIDNKDLASILGAFNACIGLYAKALDIKDHAIIGLLAILGVGYLMMMMRELRMQGEFNLPGGVGGSFRSEQSITPEEAADKVANAAVDEAEDISAGRTS